LIPKKLHILNPFVFLDRQHHYYHLPSTYGFLVQFVYPDGTVRNPCPGIWIVPKFVTTALPSSATSRMLAARFCAKRLNLDCMHIVSRYLGGPRYYDRVTGIASFEAKIDETTTYTTVSGPIEHLLSEERKCAHEPIVCSLPSLIALNKE
jgi:hypothetical protein